MGSPSTSLPPEMLILIQFWSHPLVIITTIIIIFINIIIYCYSMPRQSRVPPRPFVLVSGCDTGIGRAAALTLASRGVRVLAGCLRPDEADLPDGVEVLPLDVTSGKSVMRAVKAVERRLKAENAELWAVVNNAGVCVFGPFEWQTSQQVERQVMVNVLGTMNFTKAFVPLLKPLKGRIVTLTSVNGVLAYPGLSTYSASKFALEGFLRALRLELRPEGVEVVCVRPGDYARATGIMALHRKNAREMWDALTEAQREEVTEEGFWSYHESALRNCGLSSPNTLDGSPILRDIQSAVLDETVPSLYVSAPFHHRVVYSILQSVPESWRDFLLGYVYDMLSGRDTALNRFVRDM